MKSLSTNTRTLIDRLEMVAKHRQGYPKNLEDAAALLRQIAASGEMAAIPFLVPYLLHEQEPIAAATADTLRNLVSLVPPFGLVPLDQGTRSRSAYGDPLWSRWWRLRAGEVKRLLRFGPAAVALVGLASFHRSGYVREAAVQHLATVVDGSELPFLLLRANDWVEPVRRRAAQAVLSRIAPGYIHHFVHSLPLVLRLTDCVREDHAELVTAITGLLRSDAARPFLLEGIRSADPHLGRCWFRLASGLEREDLHPIVAAGLRARDPVLRLWAAREAPRALDGEELPAALLRMRRDRFVAVRCEGLRALIAVLPEEAPAELRQALLDPNTSVRALARYYLRKQDPIDFAAFYREAVAREDEALGAALLGLAETGAAADAHMAQPLVDSPVRAVRLAALRCLAWLDGDAHTAVFLKALRDDQPSITREAAKALTTRLSLVDQQQIVSLFGEDPRWHVRRAALSLLERLRKWESLPHLVRAMADPDSRIAAQGKAGVARWIANYNGSFVDPTAEQLLRLEQAIEGSQPALSPAELTRLRHCQQLATDILRRESERRAARASRQ
jgi:HEAT repeat protein